MTGHGGTESKNKKKQESDQTVLTTRKRLPKRPIVLVKPEKVEGTTKKIFSGTSRKADVVYLQVTLCDPHLSA